MKDKEIKNEVFWVRHRDEIIVGVIIVVLGAIAYAIVSGVGTKIYSWFSSSREIGTPQQRESLVDASRPTPMNLSIQGYSLADLSTTTINALLDKVRSEHKVRPLVALESGKKLSDVPVLTYSFLFKSYLRIQSYENYKTILDGIADRFNDYNRYFEIHKLSEQEIYLLGFSSEESYVNINNLKVGGVKSITLFPYPDIGKDYLLIVPIIKITKSTDREITLDDESRIGVLDLSLSQTE